MKIHILYRNARLLLIMLLLTAASAAHGQAVQDDCSPPHRIEWPANQPVWSLCWISPDNSSGIDGSGLELRDVFYKNKRVLRRASMPLLNVNYDPGGCGSYRDWQHGSMTFETDGVVGPPEWHFAKPAAPPHTMCDHPGTDAGDFAGVASQETPEYLVLTTQLQAGPYRYTQHWTFHLDGSIDARVAFTSRVDPCTSKPHDHHAYWRLEFGIGPDGKDYAEEAKPQALRAAGQWSRFHTESSRRNDPVRGSTWRVQSASAQRGYEITSPAENGAADPWAVADLWVLAAHPEELDDGGARQGPGGSAAQLNQYLNGESVENANLVLWIHATDRHDGSGRCRFIGPTLRPVGKW
jgi:hypothetical protein